MNNKRLEQIKQKLPDDIPSDIETAESVVLELVEEVERLQSLVSRLDDSITVATKSFLCNPYNHKLHSVFLRELIDIWRCKDE